MAHTVRKCPCKAKGDCKGDTRLNSARKVAAKKVRRQEDRKAISEG